LCCVACLPSACLFAGRWQALWSCRRAEWRGGGLLAAVGGAGHAADGHGDAGAHAGRGRGARAADARGRARPDRGGHARAVEGAAEGCRLPALLQSPRMPCGEGPCWRLVTWQRVRRERAARLFRLRVSGCVVQCLLMWRRQRRQTLALWLHCQYPTAYSVGCQLLTQCLCAQELVKRTAAVLVDAANDPNGKAAQQIEVRLALLFAQVQHAQCVTLILAAQSGKHGWLSSGNTIALCAIRQEGCQPVGHCTWRW